MNKKGLVIVNAQQKGGVGKTTNTCMEAIIASSVFDKKVLVIDTDMQGNSTSFLSKTYDIESFPKTLMKCLEEGDLKSGIAKLDSNIDIIPGSYDTRNYGTFLIENFKNVYDRTFYLKTLLEKVRYEYDYIFIDVPPATDIIVDNAMVASNYVIIVQETQQFAFEGSVKMINEYLQGLINDFGDSVKLEIAGFLPMLLQSRRPLHDSIVSSTVETFGRENVFKSIVKNHARLEWYPKYGLEYSDYHDKMMFALYGDIFHELEERINHIESGKDLENFEYDLKYWDSYTTSKPKLTEKGKGLKPHGKFVK